MFRLLISTLLHDRNASIPDDQPLHIADDTQVSSVLWNLSGGVEKKSAKLLVQT